MRYVFLSVLSLLICGSHAQVGETICACQPTFYEFTLDFALSGQDCNVAGTQGVKNAVCVLNTLGDENVTDLTPVLVDSITVLEIDQQAKVIGQQIQTNLSLTTGDSFSYTSVLAKPENLTAETIPTGIQLLIRGRNAESQQLTNILAVEYDNSCSVIANVTPGQQLGWAVFVSSQQ
jgi:hypothetical protein